jgi:hypothetical protein
MAKVVEILTVISVLYTLTTAVFWPINKWIFILQLLKKHRKYDALACSLTPRHHDIH